MTRIEYRKYYNKHVCTERTCPYGVVYIVRVHNMYYVFINVLCRPEAGIYYYVFYVLCQ